MTQPQADNLASPTKLPVAAEDVPGNDDATRRKATAEHEEVEDHDGGEDDGSAS